MTNREQQKKMAEKTFRFHRFLFLRYVLAVFFFANLYWFLAAMVSNAVLLILPLALLIWPFRRSGNTCVFMAAIQSK